MRDRPRLLSRWTSKKGKEVPRPLDESPAHKRSQRKRFFFSSDERTTMTGARTTTSSRSLTTLDAKLLSFGYSGSGVAWNRFCSLWLLKCGFSPRQVGAMKSLSLVGKLVAQPVWAGCADAGNPPMVLAVSVGISMLALELLRLGTRGSYYHEYEKGGENERIPFSRFWTLLGLSSSSKERSHHAVANMVTTDTDNGETAWRVAFLRVARSAASAASPVADAMVLALARDGGEAWGRQRFWGSASWGLGSVAVGAIIDKLGLEAGLFGCSHLLCAFLLVFLLSRVEPVWKRDAQPTRRTRHDSVRAGAAEEEYAPTPSHRGETTLSMRGTTSDLSASDADDGQKRSPPSGSGSGFFFGFGSFSPTTTTTADSNAATEDEEGASPPLKSKTSSLVSEKKRQPCCVAVSRGLLAVRRCAPLRLALANSVAFGTLVVSVDSILYMQLENELQVSRTLSGLATAASTAATFPVFWSSSELVARHGYWRVIAFAQCLLPLRLALHACVTRQNVAYVLLPIQLLHGPMFAAWISAAVELVDRLAPADLRASTQSLLTMAYFTLGGCLGHLIWSTTFELYGGPVTYLLAAAASLASVVIFVFFARHHLALFFFCWKTRTPVDAAPEDTSSSSSASDKKPHAVVLDVLQNNDEDALPPPPKKKERQDAARFRRPKDDAFFRLRSPSNADHADFTDVIVA